jgi:MFS family permease
VTSFIRKIYAFSFLDDLVFIYPLYTLMFMDAGLSPAQVSILLFVWAGTAFVLEVPSGALADKYSRKWLLVIAQLIRIAGYLVWLVFPSFWGFLIGFVLWGVKSAFTSGTLEAFVYDELKKENAEQRYAEVIGRTTSMQLLGVVCASAGASLMADLGYGSVILISLVSLLLSATVLLTIPSVKAVESTGELNYFATLKLGVKTAVSDKALFALITFASLVVVLPGALDEYWPVWSREVGLSNSNFAIFLGVISLVQAAASMLAYKFKGVSMRMLYFLFLINALILLAAGLVYNLLSLALLVMFAGSFMIYEVLLDSKLQDQIDSKVRATVTSVRGFMIEILALAVYLFVGTLAEVFSYREAFLAYSGVMVVIGAYYLLRKRSFAVKTPKMV